MGKLRVRFCLFLIILKVGLGKVSDLSVASPDVQEKRTNNFIC